VRNKTPLGTAVRVGATVSVRHHGGTGSVAVVKWRALHSLDLRLDGREFDFRPSRLVLRWT